MTLDDAPAPTRRALRRRGATGTPAPGAAHGVLTLDPAVAAEGTSSGSLAAADEPMATRATTSGDISDSRSDSRPVALGWLDDAAVTRRLSPADLSAATTGFIPVGADLLADAPRRSPLRTGVIVPTLLISSLAGAYAATTLLWPLHAVAPTIAAVQVESIPAPPAALPWPAQGSAAVSVAGIGGVVGSGADPATIASITKVVTALVVLDEMPLAPGEQGPEFRFSRGDSSAYWDYRANGESALDVPVGGSLTQYQLLQGMLIGSANNYADRLAGNLWPSDAVFARAAEQWLATHGVPGVTIVEPTGMDSRNAATPEALIALAEKALANPVIAEIVATRSVDLPGAGLVENTNGLLADPGVLGIKTGTLDTWNLLSAKDVTVGETTVRLYASVLGQPDGDSRLAASRTLYDQITAELQLRPSVTAGTLAGRVETVWGESVDIVTAADAAVVLWNGAAATPTISYALDENRDAGDTVGSLALAGPLDSMSVDLRLGGDIEGPTAWWRLTHPLDLFGLNG